MHRAYERQLEQPAGASVDMMMKVAVVAIRPLTRLVCYMLLGVASRYHERFFV